MRLSLAVNGQHVLCASLEAQGWLSAHINLSDGVQEAESADSVRLVAYDKSEEPNSVTSKWNGLPLSVGDKVEVTVLPDGESDSPDEITRTSESPKNLFSNVEVARALLVAVKSCDTALMSVANQAHEKEPTEELARITQALGDVIFELDRALISPTLRRHPDLLAEAQALGVR